MSKRKTPEERLRDAQQASVRARRQTIQARLDVAAANAASRGWPVKPVIAIRHILDTCALFDWDLERAEQLTRSVELQFDTRMVPPLADIIERAEAAAQAMESDA